MPCEGKTKTLQFAPGDSLALWLSPTAPLGKHISDLGHSANLGFRIIKFPAHQTSTGIEDIIDFLMPTCTAVKRIAISGDLTPCITGPGIEPATFRYHLR